MAGRRWVTDGKHRPSVDGENPAFARDNTTAGQHAARRGLNPRYWLLLHFQARNTYRLQHLFSPTLRHSDTN